MVWCSYKDVIYRLNFVWTTLILAIFALSIGFLRYFYLKSLITCWTPAQFGDNEIDYVHQTCWERNAASMLQVNEPLPVDAYTHILVVHTWIPILLIYLIIGFKIPEGIKVLLDLFTGSKPMSLSTSTYSWEERSESLAECGRDIVQKSGIVKTLSFFLVKIFILINLIVQFSLIKFSFRDQVINNDATNVTVNIFPKHLICHFEIRQLQNVADYVVQCQMPVNTLYEAFFRLYGFWILGVGILTGVMFLIHIGTLMVPPLVGIRYRGIIPEKELKLRGFSLDDALLFLDEVKDEFGIPMARSVASKMWQNPKMIRNEDMTTFQSVHGENQVPRNEYNSGDASVYPLLVRPTTT